MSTYAIGDIQGCFSELQKLLEKIHFDPAKDNLWFTGDLVNRGLQSLEVLRFVKQLGDQHVTVLGNHDLHLLAVFYGLRQVSQHDTLSSILTAPDKDELIDWLRQKPLLHYDKKLKFVMSHAGLAPFWTIDKARQLALEVEHVLASHDPAHFLSHLYGNEPDYWRDDLSGMDRLRCIINYLTRMRFCHRDGRLELSYKGEIASKPKDLLPWFDVPGRVNVNDKIIFGHWAALNGKTPAANLYALDTGCVWGNCLTALCLEDEKRYSVKCNQ